MNKMAVFFFKESLYGRKNKAQIMCRKNLSSIYRRYDFSSNIMEPKTNTVFED